MKKVLMFLPIIIVLLSGCVHTEVDVHGNLSGVVTSAGTDAPIEACAVIIDDGAMHSVVTDAQGRFLVENVLMGCHSIRFECDGFRTKYDSITIRSSKDIEYSSKLELTDLPVVTTLSVVNITYSEAKIEGKIEDDGGAKVKDYGFYFGEDTTTYQKISVDEQYSHFTYSLTGLSSDKKYWFAAFAKNETGIGRGKWISFSTSELTDAVVVTKEPYDITSTSVSLLGLIASSGNTELKESGFLLRKNSVQNYTTYACAAIDGEMRLTLTDLEEGTKYLYKAYATNSKGTFYGLEFSFETNVDVVPSVLTNAAHEISYTTATLKGAVLGDGGKPISEYGFYYGENASSLIKKVVGNGSIGEFALPLSSLSEGHRYMYQAYAKNSKGESRGGLVEFYTIQQEVPSVNTIGVKEVSYSAATVAGAINSLGTSGVQEYGFYYGLTPIPNIKVVVGSSPTVGKEYTKSLPGLDSGVKYYFTAYAKSGNVEALGEVLSFVTKAPPVVSTSSQYTLGLRSIVAGGTAQSASTISSCGICWSVSDGVPTVADNIVYSSTNTSSFTCTISNCTNSTKYYIRAFASNQDGLSYGETIVVQSATVPTIEIDDYNSSCTATAQSGKYTYKVTPTFVVTNPSGLSITEVGFYVSSSRSQLVNTPITGLTPTVCSGSGSTYRKTKTITSTSWWNTLYFRGYMIVGEETFWTNISLVTTY